MMLPEPDSQGKSKYPPPPIGVSCQAPLVGVWRSLEPDSMDGYVKLYRSVREDGWFQSLTDRQKLAWIYLLLEVNWQPSEFGCSRCGEVFNLPAGSTAKSLSTLSNRMGCTIKVLRGHCLKVMHQKMVAQFTLIEQTRN